MWMLVFGLGHNGKEAFSQFSEYATRFGEK